MVRIVESGAGGDGCGGYGVIEWVVGRYNCGFDGKCV